jgi:hypothetical protein
MHILKPLDTLKHKREKDKEEEEEYVYEEEMTSICD